MLAQNPLSSPKKEKLLVWHMVNDVLGMGPKCAPAAVLGLRDLDMLRVDFKTCDSVENV